MTQDGQLQERMEAIESLIAEIQAAGDPRLRHAALELLQSVMDLHCAGLEKIVEVLNREGEVGRRILRSLGNVEPVSSLLLLHDLHPDGLEERVQAALERIQPSLERHGAAASVVAVSPEQVRLRLECGAPSAAVTEISAMLHQTVLAAAPDAAEIVIDGAAKNPPGGFVPLEQVMAAKPANVRT